MVESSESIQNPTPRQTSAPQEERGSAVGRVVRGIFRALILIPIMVLVFMAAFILTLVFVFRRSSEPDAKVSSEAPSDDPKATGTEMLRQWWLEKKAERH